MDRNRTANEPGTLYVVATPLGNLKDITLRALEALKNSDLIAAEDTRRTQKLLSAYDLHVRLTSYHEHNKQAKSRILIERLLRGEKVALVTDGGTPGISDPGQELVQQARESGIPVVPIPGPSAVTCALSVSGMEGGAFIFLGFLPRRKSRRRRILEAMAAQGRTAVLYESPYRIKKLLTEIRDHLGDIDVFLTRELTKIHEEMLSGTVSQVLLGLGDKEVLGEITLILAPSKGKTP
jgi:16S rRNA (cytidine1402-2'-O)-methyltransferase